MPRFFSLQSLILVAILALLQPARGYSSSYNEVQDPYEYKPMGAVLLGPVVSGKRSAIESTFLLFPVDPIKPGNKSILTPGLGLTAGWSSDHFSYYEFEWFQPILAYSEGHIGGFAVGFILTESVGVMQRAGRIIGHQNTVSLNGSFQFIGTPAFYWRHIDSEFVSDKDEFGVLIKIPLWYEKKPNYPTTRRPVEPIRDSHTSYNSHGVPGKSRSPDKSCNLGDLELIERQFGIIKGMTHEEVAKVLAKRGFRVVEASDPENDPNGVWPKGMAINYLYYSWQTTYVRDADGTELVIEFDRPIGSEIWTFIGVL